MPRRIFQLALPCCLLVGVFAAPTPAEEPSAYTVPLFAGNDLSAWVVAGCQAAVENGVLVITEGDGLLHTHHRYQDFILQWQCKPRRTEKYDSGVYFRCELPPAGKPWPARYQINLKQGDEGNLIGNPAGRSQGLVKPGEWNAYRLEVRGATAELTINGQKAWKVENIEAPAGYIALQVEVPGGGQYEFKEISLTELGFRSLFNGRDLEGWQAGGAPNATCWKASEGNLVCTGEKGPWLRTREEFGDFNLRMEYRLKEGGNSGVYLRVDDQGHRHGATDGVEVQILDDAAPRYAKLAPGQFSGSIYQLVPAQPRVSRPAGEWNSLEIEAQGDRYLVIHNGVTVAAGSGQEIPALAQKRTKGYLGLQNHSETVAFRNLRIGPPLAR